MFSLREAFYDHGKSKLKTFMDFETLTPAIPKYIGTNPYQTIPFQWSIHIQDEFGQLRQKSFLNEDADDPRERFIKALLDTVPSEGTIVVYSGYEQTVMRRLAVSFPQYADPMEALCARAFDLLKLIRENYYHPEFHGDNSLKSVLPALVPNLSYADLGVQDGSMAAVAYAKDREQFGQKIGTFQGVSFQLADMAMQIEHARTFLYRAAWLRDQERPFRTEASMAKLYCTEMASMVTDAAVQIHGGYGYTKDYPAEKYWRVSEILDWVESGQYEDLMKK